MNLTFVPSGSHAKTISPCVVFFVFQRIKQTLAYKKSIREFDSIANKYKKKYEKEEK